MNIQLKDIVIRDFERKDIPALFSIIYEKEIRRFMADWSENAPKASSLNGYVDWCRQQKDSTDVYRNKRYAIALSATDELIGMVGMGIMEELNEVEVAYFMSEKYQHKGYVTKSVKALSKWCFSVSDIPYLILTIDCNNAPSCRVAERCGFELFEKRTPISHKQPNMESDSYFYYRLYR